MTSYGQAPYPKLFDTIGKTPLVQLQRINQLYQDIYLPHTNETSFELESESKSESELKTAASNLFKPIAKEYIDHSNLILAKLEGNNPAGSVKDRAAYSMIQNAEDQGLIKTGDTLIEATSGNTGIALAMVAAIKGYSMILVMPDDLSKERQQTMAVYGAQIILTPAAAGGMEYARDVAMQMQKEGRGIVLDQFANPANPLAHYEHTAREIWQQSHGQLTHFVSAMGTTGTITGCGRYFKMHHPHVKIIGVHPAAGAKIAGIRKWGADYVPKFFDPSVVDEIYEIDQATAEKTAQIVAKTEGLFSGISAAGALAVALKIAQQTENARIAYICCDRGDRYLSTGIFA
jgi:S-sulfo-L-cysteine synthase (O-acetyl-L-serine-dependent)